MSNHLPKKVLEHLNQFPDHQTAMLEIANDVRKLQNNFEIHLQNQTRYAEEVIKVSKKVDKVDKLVDDFSEHKDLFKEYQNKINPIIDNFSGLNWSKKAIMWILLFLGAIGSLILMTKQIFR